jgi:hypothetical protein
VFASSGTLVPLMLVTYCLPSLVPSFLWHFASHFRR